jgi:hypothetical protein
MSRLWADIHHYFLAQASPKTALLLTGKKIKKKIKNF